MALLSGTWTSKSGRDLSNGVVIKRNNIDTNDKIHIDPLGIVYYDSNNNWEIDDKDIVIGALVYTSALAKTTGIFNQDSNNPTLFKFGANTADQGKGLLVIFNETFLKGLSFDPPPPVVLSTDKSDPAQLKSNLQNTLKTSKNIKDFVNQNLKPASTITSSSSVDLSNSSEKDVILVGGSAKISAIGNSANNTIVGNDTANVLDGGPGDDLLIGGLGDDQYFIDSIYDAPIELADEGIDTITSSISYILPKNFEDLILVGTATTGTGNEANNKITGNDYSNELYGLAGNDDLDGKGGGDRLFGGTGNDTYFIYTLADKIFENRSEGDDTAMILIEGPGTYRIDPNVERAYLVSEQSMVEIIGNDLFNDIKGNASNNRLNGQSGNDHLLGMAGSDQLYGGTGDDFLDGGLGSDMMVGGLGNDSYRVDNDGDQILELGAQGQDMVQSWINYTLTTNVEGLELLGKDSIKATGNTLNNTIKGNSGDNVIDGGSGKDVLTGLGGADTFQLSSKPSLFTTIAADLVTDFDSSQDRIALSKTIFSNKSVQSSSLRTVSSAVDLSRALASTNDFVYDITNRSQGLLYWNQNGSIAGAGSGGVLLVINNSSSLTGSNIVLY